MVVLAELQRKLKKPEYIDTGEPNLDAELAVIHHKISPSRGVPSSIRNDASEIDPVLARGLPAKSFTEISGLPGTGKTALTLSLATEVLQRGQKILYVSADYGRFPLERARKLKQWRARFEERIDQVFLVNIDQLMVMDLEWSQYALIIFNNFDHLVKRYWPRKEQERAYYGILERLNSLRVHSCVVATCGCSRYQTLDNTVICAPKSALAGRPIGDAVRLMLYKSLAGNSVLHTGLAFAVTSSGLQSLPPTCNDYAVPLALLSGKTRMSPTKDLSRSGTPNSVTGTPNSLKRRRSLSAPVRTPLQSPLQPPTPTNSRTLFDLGSDTPIGADHVAMLNQPSLNGAPNSELANTSTYGYVNNTTSTGSAITGSPASISRTVDWAAVTGTLPNKDNCPSNPQNLAKSHPYSDLDSHSVLPSVIPSSPERGEGVLDYSDQSSHLSSDLTPLPALPIRSSTAPSALSASCLPSFMTGEEEANEFIPNSDEDVFLNDTRPHTR